MDNTTRLSTKLIKQLKGIGCYTMALENTKRQYRGIDVGEIETISNAFHWIGSPQGLSYWAKIKARLEQMK